MVSIDTLGKFALCIGCYCLDLVYGDLTWCYDIIMALMYLNKMDIYKKYVSFNFKIVNSASFIC